ncbi:MAG: sigma-54-dependent Fis family transcriptional regulator [Planctomycetes bacterium]|nr:sigma-54-dependent Fis family transcriptional regulator [Planctomycetota bacterium]
MSQAAGAFGPEDSLSKEKPSGPIRVLIVDDDEGHAEALSEGLETENCVCRIAHSGRAGIELMSESTFDAVLTDLVMHDVGGLQVLEEARRLQPEAVVLLITGHGSVETAVDAMRLGAADYLTKPVRISELRTRLLRALETGRLRRTNKELRKQLDKRYGLEGIIGHSGPMQRIFDVLQQVSASHATVLILGDSGTGKELVARALHTNSPRKDKPFVAVNCAALSQGLIESELFGHVKGAFTGAISAKEGMLVYAEGGTLFLDEVGDMPLETQAKLLRVLEMREVQPVGGNAPRKVDVRLVAATNRDLRTLVSEGKFREDLLFRLQVVTIHLPPLCERPGDVPLLIDHFVSALAKEHGRAVRGITPEARALLVRYDWPGNVRELRNALETMVLLTRQDVLGVEDIPEHIQHATGQPGKARGHYELAGRTLAEVERDLIASTLKLTEENRHKAAKLMGIGERTLYRKLHEYGL